MATDRERRVSDNEVLFRQVNEQIELLNEKLGVRVESMTIVCECGRTDCIERVAIDGPVYERVRTDSAQFVVAFGHVEPDVEDVVEDCDGYQIIRKHSGVPAERAAELDARS